MKDIPDRIAKMIEDTQDKLFSIAFDVMGPLDSFEPYVVWVGGVTGFFGGVYLGFQIGGIGGAIIFGALGALSGIYGAVLVLYGIAIMIWFVIVIIPLVSIVLAFLYLLYFVWGLGLPE